MTDLKTLKEMRLMMLKPNEHWVDMNELKLEAIKWIKHYRKEAIEDFKIAYNKSSHHSTFFQKWKVETLTDKKILKICEEYDMIEHNVIDWVKHFFDLTEEDLE